MHYSHEVQVQQTAVNFPFFVVHLCCHHLFFQRYNNPGEGISSSPKYIIKYPVTRQPKNITIRCNNRINIEQKQEDTLSKSIRNIRNSKKLDRIVRRTS